MEETVVAEEMTVGGIFEQAGEVMTGMLSMSGNFLSGLWATTMGKIIIVLGLVGAAIGLCYRLFLRKKHV